MKTLFLLRHAKSSWKDLSLADFDRPLKKRGKEAARSIGRLFKEEKIFPSLILCSPARRTRETIKIVRETAELPSELRYEQRIYEGNSMSLLAVLGEVNPSIGLVLMVGHNPGMENLLELLTGRALQMPTAALAKINLDVEDWTALIEHGQLEWLVKPGTPLPAKDPGL